MTGSRNNYVAISSFFYLTEGFSCVPTKFDSTLIETPNKVELIQTVAQCKLMEGCYRIPYVEYHYEITYNDDGVQVESLRVSKTTIKGVA